MLPKSLSNTSPGTSGFPPPGAWTGHTGVLGSYSMMWPFHLEGHDSLAGLVREEVRLGNSGQGAFVFQFDVGPDGSLEAEQVEAFLVDRCAFRVPLGCPNLHPG